MDDKASMMVVRRSCEMASVPLGGCIASWWPNLVTGLKASFIARKAGNIGQSLRVAIVCRISFHGIIVSEILRVMSAELPTSPPAILYAPSWRPTPGRRSAW